jgi:hypothetical protein
MVVSATSRLSRQSAERKLGVWRNAKEYACGEIQCECTHFVDRDIGPTER